MTMTATLIDQTLPTVEYFRIPVSAMRPGDVVRLGYTAFVVTYPLAEVGGCPGRMLADTENGNERELHGPDEVKYSVERPVYTVEYRSDDRNGKTLNRIEYVDELDAVRTLTSCAIYDNLTLVGYGANVHPENFRH